MKKCKKAVAAGLAAAMAVSSLGASALMQGFAADAVKYEFEDGTLTVLTTSNPPQPISIVEDASASGGKCVYMKDAGDKLTVTVEVEEAAMYDLTICYKADGGKTQKMNVNGVAQSDVTFSQQSSFTESVVASIPLKAGANEIELVSFWGWTQFDYLTVTPTTYPEYNGSNVLSDPNATKETQSLMNYLYSVYGEHVISGQQEIYKYGPHDFDYEFNYIQETTGELPAIRGFDYLNCNPLYGSDDGTTDRIISWVNDTKGIATASWHINVPKNFASYNVGDAVDWSQSTYSVKDENGNDATDFDTSQVLVEGSKEREYYMLCLKLLAAELQKLQDANVPLIFRPLHEAEGGGGEMGSWFWWGKSGSAVYKELWKLTYQVLTEEYGLHNLIWEWNSYTYDTSTDWYPGDEFVDLVAYDKYNCTDWSTGQAVLVHNVSAISSIFYDLVEQYSDKKMVAMAECDSIPTLENMQMEKTGWLYFCPWYDGGSDSINFLTNPLFNDPEDLKTMYQSEYCITLDELPANLYSDDTKPTTTTTVPGQTTTTTTTTTTAAQEKVEAEITVDGSNYLFEVKEAVGDTLYIVMDVADGVTYANGCVGISATVDGTDYWVSYQWTISKSGEVKVDLNKPTEISYNGGQDKLTDTDLTAAIVAEAQNQTNGQVQIWWVNDSTGEQVENSNVALTDAYILKAADSGTVTATETTTTATETTTTGTETTTATETSDSTTTTSKKDDAASYGDVDVNGKVDLLDVIALNKALAGVITLSDQQAVNANCNTVDGTTTPNEDDAATLMQYVVFAVKNLPVTE